MEETTAVMNDFDKQLQDLVTLAKANAAGIAELLAKSTATEATAQTAVGAANEAAAAAKEASVAAAAASATSKELSTTTARLSTTQEGIISTLTAIQDWQPTIDTSICTITSQLKGLGTRLSGLEGSPPTAAQVAPGPDGCRNELNTQGTAPRVHLTPEHALADGASLFHNSVHENSSPSHRQFRDHAFHQDTNHRDNRNEFRMPKTSFPRFDGDHPKIWKEQCEKYFRMFHVPDDYKASYATLHFTGTAALWLQAYEAQHDIDSWFALCIAVNNKFGKD